jgi:hypothetical protein
MIHAFNFTCNRDLDLSLLMVSTFNKHCPNGSISVSNTDSIPEYKDYGNGAGWQASMMKLKALSDVVKTKNVQDTDFVLSVDSDVLFTSPEVFKYVDPIWGIIGTRHRPEYYTHFRHWGHMSGALIFLRGDIAKKMIALTGEELNRIRLQHFKAYNLTENEDVVLSYLARFVNANYFDLGEVPDLSSGNFENDVSIVEGSDYHNNVVRFNLKSFYHLNYCPTQFLGEEVKGKWNIPGVLKMKGIEL